MWGVKERKFCMEWGGRVALEVCDRYGEAIVMLVRVALWLGQGRGKTRFCPVIAYRSLFIQARGVLKKELMDHLRSKRRMRRSRHAIIL
jgi:hypothetical protein